MTKSVDCVGTRFGKLTVIERAESNKFGKARWRCLCDCGGEVTTTRNQLVSGNTRSCGCLHHKALVERNTKHGHANRGKQSPAYYSWCSMLSRCRNENYPKYSIYGALGVTVCERWLNFENFLADMGERPKGTTLDRIDPFGNYEADNCRWATPTEQANNQRRHHVRRSAQE